MPSDLSKAFRGMRALVAGGSGFIGTGLVRMLFQWDAGEVVVLGLPHEAKKSAKNSQIAGARFIACDLASPVSRRAVRKLGAFDYVFNLAGMTDQRMPHPNPQELYEANAFSLMHLTEAIDWERVQGAVYAGSCAEYGSAKPPHREDMPLSPVNMYGWSKICATHYALTMARAGFAHWCVARPFFVYGPGQRKGFLPELIRALRAGKTFKVASVSTRDPVFVDDVAEGLLRLAISPAARGEVVNISNGKEMSMRRIAEMAHREIGKGKIIFRRARLRPGDMARSFGSNEKLRRITGWFPSVALAEGLKKTIAVSLL